MLAVGLLLLAAPPRGDAQPPAGKPFDSTLIELSVLGPRMDG